MCKNNIIQISNNYPIYLTYCISYVKQRNTSNVRVIFHKLSIDKLTQTIQLPTQNYILTYLLQCIQYKLVLYNLIFIINYLYFYDVLNIIRLPINSSRKKCQFSINNGKRKIISECPTFIQCNSCNTNVFRIEIYTQIPFGFLRENISGS